MVLKLWQVTESSGKLVKTVLTGPTPRIAGSAGNGGKNMRICIFQKLNPQAWFAGLIRGEVSNLERPDWDKLPGFPVSPVFFLS